MQENIERTHTLVAHICVERAITLQGAVSYNMYNAFYYQQFSITRFKQKKEKKIINKKTERLDSRRFFRKS